MTKDYLQLARAAFDAANYQCAVAFYRLYAAERPELAHLIQANLRLARKRFAADPSLPRSGIVVYTCNFGNYETIKEPTSHDPDVDYVLFTDRYVESTKWRQVLLPCGSYGARRASRLPKLVPHKFLPAHEISVYLDSSLTLHCRDVVEMAHRFLGENDLAAYPHFSRQCVFEEIDECLRLGKGERNKSLRWRKFLAAKAFPVNFGLLENAFLIRRNTSAVRQLCERWHRLFSAAAERDQFYLMYLLWRSAVRYTSIDDGTDFRSSSFLSFQSHN